MDTEFNLVSERLLHFELQGSITQNQKTTLASAISRLLNEAVRKRDALEVIRIQEMASRLDALKTKIQDIEALHSHAKKRLKRTKKQGKVFIVHGRDNRMRYVVTKLIEELELKPIVLQAMPNKGRTIIEKLTDYSKVDYAVILLSPDDMGYLKKDGPKKAKPRARQNVVLELGFFLGRIGREHVAALYPTTLDFDFPSDYAGIAYIPYDKHTWKYRLAEELQASGFKVNATKSLKTR